uniref:Uncharacterized protein n=1 Tax=Lotus japonicus TaxID=34305 RepID=I3T6U7_LOTJA|nr:unknown [Lotus japonicus]
MHKVHKSKKTLFLQETLIGLTEGVIELKQNFLSPKHVFF